MSFIVRFNHMRPLPWNGWGYMEINKYPRVSGGVPKLNRCKTKKLYPFPASAGLNAEQKCPAFLFHSFCHIVIHENLNQKRPCVRRRFWRHDVGVHFIQYQALRYRWQWQINPWACSRASGHAQHQGYNHHAQRHPTPF